MINIVYMETAENCEGLSILVSSKTTLLEETNCVVSYCVRLACHRCIGNIELHAVSAAATWFRMLLTQRSWHVGSVAGDKEECSWTRRGTQRAGSDWQSDAVAADAHAATQRCTQSQSLPLHCVFSCCMMVLYGNNSSVHPSCVLSWLYAISKLSLSPVPDLTPN